MTNPSLCQAVFSKTSGVGSCFEHFFIPRSYRLPPTPTDIHKRPQTIVHGTYMAILVTLRNLEDQTTINIVYHHVISIFRLAYCNPISVPGAAPHPRCPQSSWDPSLCSPLDQTGLPLPSRSLLAVVDRLLRRPHDLSHWVPLSKKMARGPSGPRLYSNVGYSPRKKLV